MASKKSTESASETLVIAKFVQGFKMVNGSYQSQGKVGAAILCEKGHYQLLIYRDKNTHLSINAINKDFKFQILPKNYCTFYDKDQSIWSILFKNVDELAEFAVEVVRCRWNSMKPPVPKNEVLLQQLTCPSDKSEEILPDSRVEISYAVYPIEDSANAVKGSLNVQKREISVVDSNWSKHLVGLQLLSKVALVMDCITLDQLRFPRPQSTPHDSAVIVIITVDKFSKELACPDLTGLVTALPSLKDLIMPSSFQTPREPSLPVLPTLPSLPQLDKPASLVADRQDSESEGVISDTSSRSSRAQRSHRAEVMSRVARMGQPLPFNVPTPRTTRSESDETEDDYVSNASKASGRSGGSRNHARSPRTYSAKNSPPTLPPTAAIVANPAVPQLPLHANNVPASYVVYSPTESQAQFNMFCSEVRTTNSELRMCLTRVYDKVEALTNRIEGNGHSSNSHLNSVLERISSNEQQLKQIKDQLQEVFCAVKDSSANSQGRSDGDRRPANLEEIQKLQEENFHLRSKTDALTEALQNARIANRDNTLTIESLQSQYAELRTQFSLLDTQFKESQAEKTNIEGNVVKLQSILREKQATIDRLEMALKRSEENCIAEVRKSLEEVMDPKVTVMEHLKKILNLVHKHVKAQFNPPKQYDAIFIHSVLTDTLRGVALEYFQKCAIGQASPPSHSRSSSTADQKGQEESSVDDIKSLDKIISHTLIHKPALMDCSAKISERSLHSTNFTTGKNLESSSLVGTSEVLSDSTVNAQSESLPNVKLEGRVNGVVKTEPEDIPIEVISDNNSTVDKTVKESTAVEDSSSSDLAQKLPKIESASEIKVLHFPLNSAQPATQSLHPLTPFWTGNSSN